MINLELVNTNAMFFGEKGASPNNSPKIQEKTYFYFDKNRFI